MTGKTYTISQPRQAKFDTDGVSIGIDNICYVTMFNSKQDFVVTLRKGCPVIN